MLKNHTHQFMIEAFSLEKCLSKSKIGETPKALGSDSDQIILSAEDCLPARGR